MVQKFLHTRLLLLSLFWASLSFAQIHQLFDPQGNSLLTDREWTTLRRAEKGFTWMKGLPKEIEAAIAEERAQPEFLERIRAREALHDQSNTSCVSTLTATAANHNN